MSEEAIENKFATILIQIITGFLYGIAISLSAALMAMNQVFIGVMFFIIIGFMFNRTSEEFNRNLTFLASMSFGTSLVLALFSWSMSNLELAAISFILTFLFVLIIQISVKLILQFSEGLLKKLS